MSQAYLDYAVDSFRQQGVMILIANLCLGTLGPGLPEAYHLHCQQLNEKVARWAKENGLPFFALLPVIVEAFHSYSPYEVLLENDGHPTKMVHAMMAQALAPWISTALH